MGLVATAASNKEFQMVPSGAHLGRCYMVVDLGTQDTTFQGKPKKSHKVLIGWELLNEKMEDGRPFVISSRYTMSLFEQAMLRQHLESWRGSQFTEEELNGFNIGKLLGHYCMLSVVHNKHGDKTYANVAGVMPLPKGMEKPAPVNPNILFDIESGDITKLPEWIQNVVKKSEEWQARSSGRKFDDLNEPPPGMYPPADDEDGPPF